jgi:protein SCO1/2
MKATSRERRALIVSAALAGVAAMLLGGLVLIARRDTSSAASTDLEHLGNYGEVPFFGLIERSGRRFTRDDLRGSVWVLDFIYTECTETCPAQSLAFAQLQREFAPDPSFRLVSITVDPAHDTPAVLRSYAERYGATGRWSFLTGDKRAIYCLARNGFHLAVSDPRSPDAADCAATSWFAPRAAWASHGSEGLVMHSARFVVVDRHGRIRAYHLATDPDSLARLRANVRRLLRVRPGEENR